MRSVCLHSVCLQASSKKAKVANCCAQRPQALGLPCKFRVGAGEVFAGSRAVSLVIDKQDGDGRGPGPGPFRLAPSSISISTPALDDSATPQASKLKGRAPTWILEAARNHAQPNNIVNRLFLPWNSAPRDRSPAVRILALCVGSAEWKMALCACSRPRSGSLTRLLVSMTIVLVAVRVAISTGQCHGTSATFPPRSVPDQTAHGITLHQLPETPQFYNYLPL